MMCKAYVFNYTDTLIECISMVDTVSIVKKTINIIDSQGHIKRFNKNKYKVVIGL